jgi:type II secretory pathway pseudopilin PulG
MLATFFSRRPRPEPKGKLSNAREALTSQAGDTLIEVVVSAMLVGLIVVAVLTGFNETNKVSQDERAHDQASVLAAESQEQLRSDPAPALALIATPEGHVYETKVGGTTYTITQKAEYINGAGEASGCANSKGETEATKYIEITSSVKWTALGKVRAPVKQASVITPPDGSGLEVDITNLGSPESPVAGVTVLVEGATTTTGAQGCVIYTGIPATAVNAEIYKVGYVTPSGEHKIVAKEISIAPNIITHYHNHLAAGGSITANFKHNGATAKGDTFVAANNAMGVKPEFEVGSTKFAFNGEEEYEALTGTTTEGYATSATTPVKSPSYPTGDLFPFTSAWTVYAGDCTENNPAKYGTVLPGSAIVPAGGNVSATVPTSYDTLNLYRGASGTTPVSTAQEVKITNLSCETQVANNAIKANYEHRQLTNAEGHLEVPYQPFGEFEICVAYNNTTSGAHSLYKHTYKNTTEAGITLPSIYIEGTSSEWTVTNTGTTTSKC